jgi:hypothetical protein
MADFGLQLLALLTKASAELRWAAEAKDRVLGKIASDDIDAASKEIDNWLKINFEIDG